MQDPTEQRYLQTCRVVSEARFFVLRGEDFAEVVRRWFPMAIHLLEGLFQGLNRSQQIIIRRAEDRQHDLTHDALQSPFGFGQPSLERFVMKSNIWSERMKLHACRFNRSTIVFARCKYRRVTARFEAESDGEVRVQVAQRAVCG